MTDAITTQDGQPVDQSVLDQCLRQIAASGVLGEKSRLRTLLNFVVEETIAGRGASLKAYTIGTLALGRGDNFDPSSDSIVRVEMNRLRQALGHYYDTKGEGDSLIITIPKGSYRPVFLTGKPVSTNDVVEDAAGDNEVNAPGPSQDAVSSPSHDAVIVSHTLAKAQIQVLYGRRDILESMVPYQGGGDMI
ncbi:MAG: hypothetical protein AAF213_13195, partial [Pseudomonadota bacterium]